LSRRRDAIAIDPARSACETRHDIGTIQSRRTARGVLIASRMEEPFVLRTRKGSPWLLALLCALWLSVGAVSMMYLADSGAASSASAAIAD
jgi:hypothetical protein